MTPFTNMAGRAYDLFDSETGIESLSVSGIMNPDLEVGAVEYMV